MSLQCSREPLRATTSDFKSHIAKGCNFELYLNSDDVDINVSAVILFL